jgi:hypothetical protein
MELALLQRQELELLKLLVLGSLGLMVLKWLKVLGSLGLMVLKWLRYWGWSWWC